MDQESPKQEARGSGAEVAGVGKADSHAHKAYIYIYIYRVIYKYIYIYIHNNLTKRGTYRHTLNRLRYKCQISYDTHFADAHQTVGMILKEIRPLGITTHVIMLTVMAG